MRLFQMLDDMPLQQSDDPATYEAVQHLQFTDQLYDLLGRPVSLQCNMRRLLWIFPVTPARAEQLAGCRCFDTLHARINVCLQTKDDLARRVHPWSLETTDAPTTEPTNEGTGRYPPGLDRILMKPADMGLV
ncbi:uncharacterized protein LOC122389529 [Amphibalanus amphitrite]|nr:uncharacterized protein LOC122389529 [Amphibalanus amphitrite]